MSETAEIIEAPATPVLFGRAFAPNVPQVAATPDDMIRYAVQTNAGIETIERLLALKERVDAANARKAFDAAVAAAKGQIKPVVRNRTGHNNKGYADFAAIAKAVDPILAQHGLSYRFRTSQAERITVTCILAHRDGHSEETTLSGPADKTGSKNDIQAIGSTLTYLQRYSLVQALGLAAADDDDGRAAGASVETITEEQADKLREQITALLTETQSDVDKFLAFVGAESVSDIPADKLRAAVDKLNAKKRKAVQQ